MDRGVVTIPGDVREALAIREGDFVEFEVVRVVNRGARAVALAGDPEATPLEADHASPVDPVATTLSRPRPVPRPRKEALG